MLDEIQQAVKETLLRQLPPDSPKDNLSKSVLSHCKRIAQQILEHMPLSASEGEASERNLGDWPHQNRRVEVDWLQKLRVANDVMRPEVMTSRLLVDFLADHSDRYHGKTVVDMGCGCGIIGLLMARQGARTVYCADIMQQAVDCTARNRDAILEEPDQLGGDVYGGVRFVVRQSDFFQNLYELLDQDKKPDLIIYNHPFFPYAPGELGNTYPVARTMLAPPSETNRFLYEAKRYNCPIIMPFFTVASDMLPLEASNDPVHWALKNDYSAVMQHQEDVEHHGLQDGYCRIYEFRPRRPPRLHVSVFEDKGELYEKTDWGTEYSTITQDGAIASKGTPAGQGILASQSVIQQRAAVNLFLQVCSHVRSVQGMLLIYIQHLKGKKRAESNIISRSTIGRLDADLEPWKTFGAVYENAKQRFEELKFDPTQELLIALEQAANDIGSHNAPLPVVFIFKTTDKEGEKPSVTVTPMDMLRRRHSFHVVIRFALRDGHYAAPNEEDFAKASEAYEEFSRFIKPLFNREKEFFDGYLQTVMAEYFNVNENRSSNPDFKIDRPVPCAQIIPNLRMVLLPLWAGTPRNPIGIGSLLLYLGPEEGSSGNNKQDNDTTNKTSLEEELLVCSALATEFVGPIRIQQTAVENQRLNKQAVLQARRAAAATIIARNMSHNIGSHVVSRVRTLLSSSQGAENNADVADLLGYLQQRMDFVAQAATSAPLWSADLNCEEVLDNFQLKLMCDYLISFAQNASYGNSTRKFGESYDPPIIDPASAWVSIPHGIVGCHALYAIFENLLRNAMLHAGSKVSKRHVQAWWAVLEHAEGDLHSEYWKLRVSDGATPEEDCDELNKRFKDAKILDADRRVTQEAWGLKEIKIAAGVLRMIPSDLIDNHEEKRDPAKEPPLVHVTRDKNGTGKAWFEFHLLRPKHAIMVDPQVPLTLEIWERSGISHYDSYLNLCNAANSYSSSMRHEFLYLNAPLDPGDRAALLDCLERLPMRIVLGPQMAKDEVPPLIWSRAVSLGAPSYESPEAFLAQLWRAWTEPINCDLVVACDFYRDGELSRLEAHGRLRLIQTEDEHDQGQPPEGKFLMLDHYENSDRGEWYRGAEVHETFKCNAGVGQLLTRAVQEPRCLDVLQDLLALKVWVIDERISQYKESRRDIPVPKYTGVEANRKFESVWLRRRVQAISPNFMCNFAKTVDGKTFDKLSDNDKHNFVLEHFERFVEWIEGKATDQDEKLCDVLIIHETTLSKRIKPYIEQEMEPLLNRLNACVRSLILVTGKGKPELAKTMGLRWMEFSNLESALLYSGGSKVLLSNLIYSIRAPQREAHAGEQ